jgi:hypothetical protein
MEGPTEQNFEVSGFDNLYLEHHIARSEIEDEILDDSDC